MEVLKEAASCSIKSGEPVWFGCDLRQDYDSNLRIRDKNLYDRRLLFDTSGYEDMTKEERLVYRDSLMTHAMVLTGFTEKQGKDGGFEKWKVDEVENGFSHGNGYGVISDDWFSEYVYEVVVDKSFVPSHVLDVLTQDPTQLEAWDPMGYVG